jgi:hypothetical protein
MTTSNASSLAWNCFILEKANNKQTCWPAHFWGVAESASQKPLTGRNALSQTNGRTKGKEKLCNDLLPKAPSTRHCLLQLSCAAVRHLLFSFAFSWRVDRASWSISSPGASCSANVFYIHIPFPHSKLPRTSLSLLLCPPPHMQRMQKRRRMCCCFYDDLLRTGSNLSSCTVVVNAPQSCWPDVIQK